MGLWSKFLWSTGLLSKDPHQLIKEKAEVEVTPRAEISEAPRSADLECGKRNLKRSQEVPFKATGRETVTEDVPEKEKVIQSISVLNRTRESLANDSCPDHYRTVPWHFSCYGAEKST